MGCGASSGKGSVSAGPKEPEKAGSSPAPQKGASGKSLNTNASLGRRRVNDSILVSTAQRPKSRELATTDPLTPASSGPSASHSSRPTASTATPPAAPSPEPAPPAARGDSASSRTSPAPTPSCAAADPAPDAARRSRPASASASASAPPSAAVTRPASASGDGLEGRLPPLPSASPTRKKLSVGPAAPSVSESGGGGGGGAYALDTAARPALQIPRLSSAPLSCLAPPRHDAGASTSELPAGTREHIEQLGSGDGGPQGQAAAAAAVRHVLCGRGAPIGGLLDAGAAAALVRCLREGPAAAKVDAAWALTNIGASPDYYHAEALCNAAAPEALVEALEAAAAAAATSAGPAGAGAGQPGGCAPLRASSAASGSGSGRPSSSGSRGGGGGGGGSGGRPGLAEQLLWALGNLAGAVHPEMKAQALAVDVLDAGALKLVFAVLEAEADAAVGAPAAASVAPAPAPADDGEGDGGAASAAPRLPPPPPVPGPASPLLRCAAWCLHNLAKHKREKDMVTAIPLATRLLLECCDPEVLVCCAWLLAYLGSNEDNKSHLKQALPALPRLVEWVSDASGPLATPSLLCLGTMCTGYMKALDYSGQVVEAGGVPAMLSYLSKAGAAGRRGGVKEALFALSNVAGGSNATVKAMLDAGAFRDVLSLLRSPDCDEDVRVECLYVLTNPWDPLVGTEVATVQQLLAEGILDELDNLLEPDAPAQRLGLLLKGLADGLKRGQQLMTAAATAQLLEHGREGSESLPRPANPVVELYVRRGTVPRIATLNGHSDEEVATRANGILTVLQFFME